MEDLSRWPCGLKHISEAAWGAGIVGSNPADSMNVRLLCVCVCVFCS